MCGKPKGQKQAAPPKDPMWKADQTANRGAATAATASTGDQTRRVMGNTNDGNTLGGDTSAVPTVSVLGG